MRLLLAEDEKDLSDALMTVLKHNKLFGGCRIQWAGRPGLSDRRRQLRRCDS